MGPALKFAKAFLNFCFKLRPAPKKIKNSLTLVLRPALKKTKKTLTLASGIDQQLSLTKTVKSKVKFYFIQCVDCNSTNDGNATY
jgi:hypothetical protein